MSPPQLSNMLSRDRMLAILEVTRALAAPFELHAMLEAVATAARRMLRAERVSVWLHDSLRQDLFVEVATDLPSLRVPMGQGLVGSCARDRVLINVPDCYADPRFNVAIDRQLGFRTRCSLTVPLVDHRTELVGVLQLLNREQGVFGPADEDLALAMAAQCAVALSRVRMTKALIAAELVEQEVELASVVQRCTLPAALPVVAGYDMQGAFLPASRTGGDTYDLALVKQGLLMVLADATGHGMPAALSVMQMHAMLRMAIRMGASLEDAFHHVNDQLVQVLADGRFVTAFMAFLDPALHRVRFLSGGQSPILHYRVADDEIDTHRATSFPMGAMLLAESRSTAKPAVEATMAPGDWWVVLSDGVYEFADATGQLFGKAGVARVLRAHKEATAAQMVQALLAAVREHAAGAPQEDDMTFLLLRRDADR